MYVHPSIYYFSTRRLLNEEEWSVPNKGFLDDDEQDIKKAITNCFYENRLMQFFLV